MAQGVFCFDCFTLDAGDRLLRRDGEAVELNARYLDALVLLVAEEGRLVSKTRFMDEVWRGVPVTDEALTQCIRMLRRQLGDDAARPRFIETAPKHGYRFIAPVTRMEEGIAAAVVAAPAPAPAVRAGPAWRPALRLGAAGMLGGGFAGILGGLFYGLVGVSDSGGGTVSALLVLVCLTMLVGVIGGAGVSFGVVGFEALGRRGPWAIAGGAAGGLVVGAAVKLIGVDAFDLLFGQTPGAITGAPEGLALGAAVGLGSWLAGIQARAGRPGRAVAVAGACAAAAGALIPALGGRLMGGSLDLLADRFPGSRLRVDHIGALFGETGFGPLSQIATGAVEGLLFGACVAAAMVIARLDA